MAVDLYNEALYLTRSIKDPYLRAITYARIGYYMHRAKNPRYGEAFTRALKAVASIDNPLLIVKALIEVATFLGKTGSKGATKTFIQAYESIKTFPQPLRDEMLEELVHRLLELGRVDDAFFYAKEIENRVKRNDTLLQVLHNYIEKGNLRKARLILELIEDEPWHSIAAYEVLKEHLKREEFGSAIKVLSEFQSEYWLGEAMKAVAVHLKKANVPEGTYEKFVDIALGISSKVGFEVLISFLIGVAAQGEIDFVIGVLSKVPRELRPELLKSIVLAVLDRPELLERLVDRLIGDEKELVMSAILDALLERQPNYEYYELVKRIGSETDSERVIVKAVRYLSKLHAYDDAWELASKVTNPYLRSLAFGSIAVEKLKENDVDGAIDASLEVKDPRWGSWLLSEILAKILEVQTGGELKEDIEERAEAQRKLWEGS
ncbi:hypothetical protein [Thermococcus nautili]|uniref:Uncharacterized protein n=1 Tax=Thermococcus nautili TaxID=195522 RepID=W8P8D2_9EURY|nr:hypothetical protein [Thermococcus nautili]AHL23805.1 hypothetical protein BD01_2215 [Thermococcus nautili]